RSRFQFCSIRAKCSNCSLFMYCSTRRAMYRFTLRGAASKLAGAADSPSPSSSICGTRVTTSGRVSNLIGATFSWLGLAGSGFGRGTTATGLTVSGFAIAGFTITGFAIAGLAVTGLAMGLGAGLLGFTVTFDVAGDDVGLAGGRTAFFLGATALCAAFLGVALP